VVRHEPYQGKGNVVRRMLADIDTDIYVREDGDLTYDMGTRKHALRQAHNAFKFAGIERFVSDACC